MSKEFPGQREGEVVEVVFRKHEVTAWRGWVWVVVWSLVGVVPMFVQYGMAGGVARWFDFGNGWWRDFTEVVGQNSALFYIWLGCFGVGVVGLFYNYVMWYFSYFVVTNQRIRQVRQKGIFRKTVADLEVRRIENIKCEVPMMGGILGYGTLVLGTKTGRMEIGMVKNVEKIYNSIEDLVGRG